MSAAPRRGGQAARAPRPVPGAPAAAPAAARAPVPAPRHRSARGSGSAPRMTQLRCRSQRRGGDGESPRGTLPAPHCRDVCGTGFSSRRYRQRLGALLAVPGAAAARGPRFQLLRWWLKIPNPAAAAGGNTAGWHRGPGVPARHGTARHGSARLPAGFDITRATSLSHRGAVPDSGGTAATETFSPPIGPGGDSTPGWQRPAGPQMCRQCPPSFPRCGTGGGCTSPSPRLAAGPGPQPPSPSREAD